MKSKHKTFILETKYNEEATEKGLIKITPETLEEIVFSADEMLELIAADVRKKDIALALTSTDVEHIIMTEIDRTFHFTADKDYVKGETTSFNVKHAYPVVLAAAEAVYNLCKESGTDWIVIDKEKYKEAVENLSKSNKGSIEKMYKMSPAELEGDKK
jgi:hypothetical protein